MQKLKYPTFWCEQCKVWVRIDINNALQTWLITSDQLINVHKCWTNFENKKIEGHKKSYYNRYRTDM